MVKVTLIKSASNEVKSVKATVAALGLKTIRSEKVVEETTATIGQQKKESYLLKVEKV